MTIEMNADTIREDLREMPEAHDLSEEEGAILAALPDDVIENAILAESEDFEFWEAFNRIRANVIRALAIDHKIPPRFYPDDSLDPAEHPGMASFGPDTVGIVDTAQGGVVAYVHRDSAPTLIAILAHNARLT